MAHEKPVEMVKINLSHKRWVYADRKEDGSWRIAYTPDDEAAALALKAFMEREAK